MKITRSAISCSMLAVVPDTRFSSEKRGSTKYIYICVCMYGDSRVNAQQRSAGGPSALVAAASDRDDRAPTGNLKRVPPDACAQHKHS